MINDAQRIYDGFDSQEFGVDGGQQPHKIDPRSCEDAENFVFRGGAPTIRPAILDVALTFDNPNLSYFADGRFATEDGANPQSQNVFSYGTFQGAHYYAPSRGKECIMAAIAGHLYQITPGENYNGTVRDIRLDRRNRGNLLVAYMTQADVYFLLRDGEARTIIFDGVSARRATDTEIPVGKMLAYGMGRVVGIGLDDTINFYNIYDGKGNGGADVLEIDESLYLNEGFATALPPSMGRPTAINFLPQQDTATGQGQCVVFGDSGGAGFDLGIPRETWKDSQFQREILLGVGNYGHRNTVVVNGDLWFRAKDGRRSLRQARAEIDKWGQIPLSTNVRRYVDSETAPLLEYGSAIEFDNRLLTTCTPIPNVVNGFYAMQRLYHDGILSLDFDVLSTFGEASRPAWDGRFLDKDLKTLRVLQLVTGKFGGQVRAFAFVENDQGKNTLVELTRDGVTDTAGRITGRIRPRSMNFQSQFNEKRLYGGDIWLSDVAEPVTGVATYRPDQIDHWEPWDTFSALPNGTGGEITAGGVPTMEAGYAPRLSLKKPLDTGDPYSGRIYRRGYEMQPELRITGHCAIREFRMQDQNELEKSLAKKP